MEYRMIWRASRAAVIGAVALACTAQPQASSAAASGTVPSTGWIDATATLDPSTTPVYAFVAPDAAQQLADAGVKLVGIDYISAEQFGAPAPLTHRTLLGKGIPIVEGLALENVPAGDYDVIILPIKVGGQEAAPARAILRRRAR